MNISPDTKLPAGVLRNTATGRFHPIVFRPAPMPSGVDANHGMLRHRSKQHHTEGFATMDEAVAFIAAQPTWTATATATGAEWEWEWNGEGVPAITHWFALGTDGPTR